MEKPPRGFKGIWIPAEIWLSEDLLIQEKVLFAEIYSLDNERGCFASNQYFEWFFNIKERQIRNLLRSLREKGLISVTVRNKNERTIKVIGRYRHASKKDRDQFQEDFNKGGRRWQNTSKTPGREAIYCRGGRQCEVATPGNRLPHSIY